MFKELQGLITAIAQLHPTVQVIAILGIGWLIKGGYILNKKRKDNKNKSSAPQTGHVTEHTICPNFPSLILLVKNAINKMAQVQMIQINTTISEQMNEFDDLYVDFKKIFKSQYMALYREKTKKPKSGILKEKDVQHYIAILSSMESQLKGLTRGFLKKNHFLDKSDEEFRLYLEDRSEDYQNEISIWLDDHYDSDIFIISREDLYDHNLKHCKQELKVKAEKFFYKVRLISLENNKKIEKLEEGIENFK